MIIVSFKFWKGVWAMSTNGETTVELHQSWNYRKLHSSGVQQGGTVTCVMTRCLSRSSRAARTRSTDVLKTRTSRNDLQLERHIPTRWGGVVRPDTADGFSWDPYSVCHDPKYCLLLKQIASAWVSQLRHLFPLVNKVKFNDKTTPAQRRTFQDLFQIDCRFVEQCSLSFLHHSWFPSFSHDARNLAPSVLMRLDVTPHRQKRMLFRRIIVSLSLSGRITESLALLFVRDRSRQLSSWNLQDFSFAYTSHYTGFS